MRTPKPPVREPGLFWPAAGRLLLAGAVFGLVYRGCNLFTSHRTDVGVCMWDWERHIPFVREFIVPYWSLDLLFCGAFFLCRSREELNLLTKRLVTVVLASGACFLLFPLKMGLPRPEPAGWTAPLFRALYAGDLPYNLAPSLHISLRSILWVFYGAHLSGGLRRGAKLWFMLIGLSTLLVHQHHVIDVGAGFLMGWAILAAFPDPRQRRRAPRDLRLAVRYGLGALACAGLAFAWIGFAWPAAALAIVALAYATGRPHLLGKENGTLSPAAEWCLLPVILLSRLIQRRWRKQSPAWCELTPGVSFGRRPAASEARALVANGPLAVLDLTAERNAPAAFREHAHYLNLPLLDLVTPPAASLDEAVEFIRRHHTERRVLIHCELGLLRSARVAEQWLIATGECPDLASARDRLRELVPALA
jgi:Dual specificity phosphatase, catalytic domain/PAP2 superfamily